MLRKFSFVVALMAGLLPPVASAQRQCTPGPPAPIRALLTQRFPGWRIVTLEDLVPSDQKLWLEAGRGQCPGFAEGEFVPGETNFAISLYKHTESGAHPTKLVLVRPSGLVILSENESAQTLVVHRGSPGMYKKWDDPSLRHRISTDTVIQEILEANAICYYWKNGAFHSLTISD